MLEDLPHILLVEDARSDSDLVQEACADAGMIAVFHLARDATEAVRCIDRLAMQGIKLELIVLDLLMPGRDGFGVLQHVHAMDPAEAAPVLVLSGSADMRHVDRCYRMGAALYLYKPVVYGDYRIVADRMADLLNHPPQPSGPASPCQPSEDSCWSLESPSSWAGRGG